MHQGYSHIEGGVGAPAGFSSSGVAAGVKKSGKRDIALVAAEKPVPAAAVFTQNAMAAPPVLLSRAHVASGLIRAVVTNSGNANACTGQPGMDDARAMAARTAEQLGSSSREIIVASTGVIGVPLPIDTVLQGIDSAVAALAQGDGTGAAEAIMTTDTFLKQTAIAFDVEERRYIVGGMAKGSGMIMPDMATMLAYVTTDAPLTPAACEKALHYSADMTFNRITVDGDTSTNDMVVLMASGAGGGDSIDIDDPAFAPVQAAVQAVCEELARMIVRDGEGATKLITVTVRGAASDGDAVTAARAIANSPLFKTAIFGRDANWGRVVMALGKSGITLDPSRVDVHFAGILTCEGGTAVAFDEAEAARALSADEVEVIVDLHLSSGTGTILTCDLTYDYVRINGEYRT